MKKIVLAVFLIGIVVSTAHANANATTVLVAGFEPWDQFDTNHSQLIAEELDGQEIGGANILGIILPVDFEEAVEVITQSIEDYDPAVVIGIGIEPDRRLITVEKIGSNLKYDYLDQDPTREINDTNGPLFRFSTLPTHHIVRHMRKSGIPARQCYNAGTYVCNALLYGTLQYIEKNELAIKAGFIHVPPLPSQDEKKGLGLETMIDAVKIAIKVSMLDIYFDKIHVDRKPHLH